MGVRRRCECAANAGAVVGTWGGHRAHHCAKYIESTEMETLVLRAVTAGAASDQPLKGRRRLSRNAPARQTEAEVGVQREGEGERGMLHSTLTL
jgi:hypothetical protein